MSESFVFFPRRLCIISHVHGYFSLQQRLFLFNDCLDFVFLLTAWSTGFVLGILAAHQWMKEAVATVGLLAHHTRYCWLPPQVESREDRAARSHAQLSSSVSSLLASLLASVVLWLHRLHLRRSSILTGETSADRTEWIITLDFHHSTANFDGEIGKEISIARSENSKWNEKLFPKLTEINDAMVRTWNWFKCGFASYRATINHAMNKYLLSLYNFRLYRLTIN